MGGDGWVKNYRKISDWEWYTTPNMAHLFQHLIRSASHIDTRWMGVEIKKGQVVIGLHSLSAATGISIRGIRTCLQRLEQSGEIIKKSTNRFTILTICKYCKYQQDGRDTRQTNDKRTTNERQTNDNIQEVKNERMEEVKEKKSIKEKFAHGEFLNVLLTDTELKNLSERFNGTLKERVDKLSAYIASTGKSYKSHYATIIMWAKDDRQGARKQFVEKVSIKEQQAREILGYGTEHRNSEADCFDMESTISRGAGRGPAGTAGENLLPIHAKDIQR